MGTNNVSRTSEKPTPSSGGDLSKGLSHHEKFHSTTPESLGQGRNMDSGKPDGPQKGSAWGGHKLG